MSTKAWSISYPGSPRGDGPCEDEQCTHTACHAARTIAAEICPECGNKIGYGNTFEKDEQGEHIHAKCNDKLKKRQSLAKRILEKDTTVWVIDLNNMEQTSTYHFNNAASAAYITELFTQWMRGHNAGSTALAFANAILHSHPTHQQIMIGMLVNTLLHLAKWRNVDGRNEASYELVRKIANAIDNKVSLPFI